MHTLRDHVRGRWEAGAVNNGDMDAIEAAVAEAEYWLTEVSR
jgi:hypothetical protein